MGSERLPSFKGPRDLSLATRSVKRDIPSGAQPRPKRVFTPNIPPKRERGTPTSSTPSTSSSSPAKPNESLQQQSTPGRGRGRGRGGLRGGRGGKQRGELVQSESIFSEGIGDPVEARRSASLQYKSGYGGGRYRSGADGGSTRLPTMNRTTLSTIIKQEDDSSRKIFGTDGDPEEDFNQEDESRDNPHAPVILPLLYYAPDTFSEPAISQPSDKTLEPVPSTSADSELVPVPTVTIKQEKDDVPPPTTSIISIKQESFDLSKSSSEISSSLLKSLCLEDSTSFARTFRDSSKDNGTLVYFQLPDELPVLEGDVREPADQQAPAPGKSSNDLVQDINELPEGFIGRLQILSNGRTRFILGENSFDVDPGRPVGFRQELYYMSDDDEKIMLKLGSVNKKFVLTPDIHSILTGSI